MARHLASLAFALSVVGCGPSTIGDLARPAIVVVVDEAGGFCSSTYAVDASNGVWLETGCGSSSGLVAQTPIDASARAELDALMDATLALPDDPGCELPNPSTRRYRFVRTLPGTDEWPEVRQCEPDVPADAQELVRRLEALVVRDADGGAVGGTDAGAPTDAGS
jgi:hypothetical protein